MANLIFCLGLNSDSLQKQSELIRLRVRKKEAFLPSAVVVHTNVYKAGRNGKKYVFKWAKKLDGEHHALGKC